MDARQSLQHNIKRRTHKPMLELDEDMSSGSRCCFGVIALLVQILLHGELALTLYWIVQYRWDAQGFPFAFRGQEPGDVDKEWNLHPVLMITGFIYCMGQAMLVYRSCRCCRRLWSKLLHTMFHFMAIPCIVIGFIAAWDYHALHPDKAIPHLYTIHSWMGLATMGLFLLQFVSGVFSFLLLLCCSSATASCRSSMVPVHSTLGTTTFLMAIATCIAGITETALFKLNETGLNNVGKEVITELGQFYMYNFSEEAIFLNTMGAILISLGILVPCVLGCEGFRKGLPREGEDDI